MSFNGFQNVVNLQPGVAQAGDFADASVRTDVVALQGALIADVAPNQPVVGQFAYANAATGVASSLHANGDLVGFVHREGQVQITSWLANTSATIQTGEPVTLFSRGSFWGLFAAGATPGQKVFAATTGGALSSAAHGATVAGSIETEYFVDTPATAGQLAQFSTWG